MNGTNGPLQPKHINHVVCECHCFTCNVSSLPNPQRPKPGCSAVLLGTISTCHFWPVSSQQLFTSSPLIHPLTLVLLSLLTWPTPPLTLLLHSAAASLLADIIFAIQMRKGWQNPYPNSDLFSSHIHSQFHWLSEANDQIWDDTWLHMLYVIDLCFEFVWAWFLHPVIFTW